MGFAKFGVSLLVLATLTATRARTISENRDELIIDEDPEHRDDSMKIYSSNKDGKEVMTTSTSEKENELYNENFMRRYAVSEADFFLRKSAKIGGKRRRSLHGNVEKVGAPFSARRLEKMLEKAILKIITGDLSTADMLLLKSFNYSLDQILAIRERELGKKMISPEAPSVDAGTKIFYDQKMNNDLIETGQYLTESSRANRVDNYEEKNPEKMRKIVTTIDSGSPSEKQNVDGDFDFDAYNRQAIYDYENGANKVSRQSDLDPITPSVDYENRSNDNAEVADVDDDHHANFDRAMEPHVVFKIRYDDSEFDSNSDERVKQLSRERIGRVITKIRHGNVGNVRESKNKTASLVPLRNEFSSSSSSLSETNTTPGNNGSKTFQASTIHMLPLFSADHRMGNLVTPYDDLNEKKTIEKEVKSSERDIISEGSENPSLSSNRSSTIAQISGSSTPKTNALEGNNVDADNSMSNETRDNWRRKSVYEGLEWVEDDVYRVIPEAVDSLNYYDGSFNEMENDTIEDLRINGTRWIEIERRNDDDDYSNNDTIGYQNENPEDEAGTQTDGGYSSMRNPPNVNLSTYQQLAMAHRRDGNITSPFDSQGQKAIEDIKLKVLAMTGRFNLSSSGNQVQRERLTMFSPICQIPRNTDGEAWSDPFLMNMHFQLNLTSGDHVVAAKVRIYVLPQDNVTVSTVTSAAATATAAATEEEDEEEKKIRISVYFYTKSLKKHRSKKRLIDSVVISLTTQGSHWALDVRQALRFWRQNLRNSHGISNNHGLVIQVEDQDGRSLKPSQYIQQDSCHTSERNEDEKAYQRVPALFVQACSRYVRVVNDKPVTYVNCRKSSRNGRH